LQVALIIGFLSGLAKSFLIYTKEHRWSLFKNSLFVKLCRHCVHVESLELDWRISDSQTIWITMSDIFGGVQAFTIVDENVLTLARSANLAYKGA